MSVQTVWQGVASKKLLIAGLALCIGTVGFGFVIVSNVIVGRFGQYIRYDTSLTAEYGIVLGAGITDEGKPFKELQARLDSAASALRAGVIQKIILSGDNRFENYNEPDAMVRYLIEEHAIDENLLQQDYAGRSTYESCERAKKIFSVDKAIIFSAYSHLPRAIFTCRKFGIEAYGIGNPLEANNAGRREFLARPKAIFNIYINGENTILGNPIAF